MTPSDGIAFDVIIPADQQRFVKHSWDPSGANNHAHYVQSHFNPVPCLAVTLLGWKHWVAATRLAH